MTSPDDMKRSHVLALLLFGLAALSGLGVLMYKLLPELSEREPRVLLVLPGVIVAVVAALFILGVFLGYFYRNPTTRWLLNQKAKAHFKNALLFERQERIRLEREQYEMKQAMMSLKDKLSETPARDAGEDQSRSQEMIDKIAREKAELEARHEQLRRDLSSRKQRIADLMTDIAIAQSEAAEARGEIEKLKSTFPPSSVTSKIDLKSFGADASIKEVLASVATLDGIERVLVADDFGLVVETSDKGADAENLAAATSLVSRTATRLKEFLPVGTARKFELVDEEGFVVEITYFELFDLRCSLTIVRKDGLDYAGLAEQTIEAIVARLKE